MTKTKESCLSCDVTRCEITVGGGYAGALADIFPKMYCFDSLQLSLDFSSLPLPLRRVCFIRT